MAVAPRVEVDVGVQAELELVQADRLVAELQRVPQAGDLDD